MKQKLENLSLMPNNIRKKQKKRKNSFKSDFKTIKK